MFLEWLLTGKESLDDRVSRVNRAVNARFGGENSPTIASSDGWPVEVFADSVIVMRDGKHYRVPYTLDETGVVVLGEDLVEVARAWVEVARAV